LVGQDLHNADTAGTPAPSTPFYKNKWDYKGNKIIKETKEDIDKILKLL
jgi:hypothetical protein